MSRAQLPETLSQQGLGDRDMNAETHRSPRLELAVLKAALIALCAIAPIPGIAQGQPEPAPETLTARVSLGDIALSTPEGQRVAYERLRQTARRLCSSLEARHPESLAHYPSYIRCVDETLARAWQRVNAPALAATQNSPR
jgi:UrcA family protein